MSGSDKIRACARELLLEAVGVCRFDTEKRPLLACRAASRIPDEAQSVIVVLFPYAVESPQTRNISRYACVPDYHKTAGDVLTAFADKLRQEFPHERFETFIDNSPLAEVSCAVAAGLGVRGDNGLLISDAFGSFVFIGCVVTTLALPAKEEARECLHCGACAAMCPGGCLPGKERGTCVSALTQKKGELTSEQQALIRRSGSLWGCDVCQDGCPMNRGKRIAPHPCFAWYDPMLTPSSLDDLTGKAYAWRGKAVLERNLRVFDNDKQKGVTENGNAVV